MGLQNHPLVKDMVWVPEGEYAMGSGDFYPEEAPVRRVAVDGFWMDEHPVDHCRVSPVCEGDRPRDDSGAGAGRRGVPGRRPGAARARIAACLRHRPDRSTCATSGTGGAGPRAPAGAGPRARDPNVGGRELHPVVHVSYEDAAAYANWAGKDLPSEAEWERAARGGLEQTVFAWGDEFAPRGRMMANTWQGEFPWQNLRTDGFERTSPIRSFPPNGFGLYDMTGNTWEWTSDWYSTGGPGGAGGADPAGDQAPSCCVPRNPRVDSEANSYGPGERIPRKVIKGGSHLCAPNYCLRYRPAARQSEAIDTSTSHIGFRCVVRP